MPSLSGHDSGRAYWRSLDELADAPGFRAFLEAEFPRLAPALAAAPNRRQFLKLMGASLALAGLTGCRWPKETIVPYAKRPQGRLPGVPVSYATVYERSGVATGLLVTSYDGRPVKVEGNDQHPDSRGATDAIAQAAMLDLYDPDRSTSPAQRGSDGLTETTWKRFFTQAGRDFATLRSTGGAGLFVLSQASSSATLAEVRERFRQAFPQARWFEYEPVSRDNERAGIARALGRPGRSLLRLDAARVVVSFDDDFLLTHPASLRYTRDFAAGRTAADGTMSRLYVVESTLSLTGSNADHRYTERPALLERRLAQLCAALACLGVDFDGLGEFLATAGGEPGSWPAYIDAIARDLKDHRGRCVVTVGPRLGPEAHALAVLLNRGLANVGKTVSYIDVPDAGRPAHLDAIRQFAGRLGETPGATVVILGGNPAYDAPADLDLAGLLTKANAIHLSLYRNETSDVCRWHLPAAHPFEAWGDARAWDGTLAVVQPLIAPLHDGKTDIELLAWIADGKPTSGYDLVRATFRRVLGEAGFEGKWRQVLHDGLVRGSAAPAIEAPLVRGDWPGLIEQLAREPAPAGDFELVFAPDNKLYDGRYANNGWLQELPDPITKLTWDNAALISTADASRLGLRRDDLVEITLGRRRLTLAVCPVPGHAPGAITLPLGYGRRAGGRVLEQTGFDTYTLRTTGGWHVARGAQVRVLRSTYRLATTQDHHAIASDVGETETAVRAAELVREGTLDEYRQVPDFARHRAHALPLVQPFDEHTFEGKPRWAMAIDLARCTGCSACVVACQAENNVPVVGKEEVKNGREMHWLRVDRYFTGDPARADSIRVAHQPLTCQQCENAPCEQVCPASATMHDQEGLNVMVYNRCVGTRYCSNNCPYKVRRFNWFYNHHGPAHPRSGGRFDRTDLTAIEQMAFNPEVTVRSRGVMEKCSFCVQRINAVKISARNERRPITDGEIVPACAQACPAGAIVFGDLNDENSAVRKAHQQPRAYAILEYLNVRPRNVYLAKLRNPSELAPGSDGKRPAAEKHTG